MKKFSLILSGLFWVNFVFSQTCVTNAWQYFNQKNMTKARIALEQCPQTDEVLNSPQYWLMKGNVYLQIAGSDAKSANPKFPDASLTAYESFVKAIVLNGGNHDVIKDKVFSAIQGLVYCGDFLFDKGLKCYNSQDYATAIKYMDYAIKCLNLANANDTTVVKAKDDANFIIALSAEETGDAELYRKTLEEAMMAGTNNTNIYLMLMGLYKADNDAGKAFEIINNARNRFPQDVSLVLEELNLLIWADKQDEFNTKMDIALKTYADSLQMMISLSNILISNKDFEKAEPVILKLVEKQPADFETNALSGALYYLKAEEVGKEKDKAALERRFKEIQGFIDQINVLNEKALIYLEKAYQKNSNEARNFIMYYQTLVQLRKPISDDLKEKYNSLFKK